MIRLAWRQFRTQALVALGALAAVALLLLLTRGALLHLTSESLKNAPVGPFDRLVNFLEEALNLSVVAVPALIGVFWGAPLVARELETGTFRLAWTQSVTRRRWLATKLVLLSLVSALVTALFSLMVTWWSIPQDRIDKIRFELFSQRGIPPIGYAVFALALGIMAGLLIRRVLPAMVTTLVAFIAARLGVTFLVRPHLLAPLHMIVALTSPGVDLRLTPISPGVGPTASVSVHLPDAWVFKAQLVDAAGHAPSAQFLRSIFGNLGPGNAGSSSQSPPQDFQDAIAKLAQSFHALVSYQPASRFWVLQGLETAVFLALALLLAWLCMRWVGRRWT